MRAKTAGRLGVAAVAGLLATMIIGAGPASAHVTVNPKEAVHGGYGKLAFRVPNEKPAASTVKLEVVIPTDAPIASISVRPQPGWTPVLERAKLPTPVKVHEREVTEVVSKITWTAAAGSEIKPGEFQEFEISAGPLPEADRIVFKALQTYSDGEIVRWIEDPAASAQAEHPAPVLKLTPKVTTTGVAATTSAAPKTSGDEASGGDSLALVLGGAGLVAGLAGLVVAVTRTRRPREAA